MIGNFSEIVEKIPFEGNMIEVTADDLRSLELSAEGQLARETILNDMHLLENEGASPILNLIRNYEKDDFFFPTDVYSWHVDRSPIPTSTFLCTYVGASSDILYNHQAEQKILVPEIRAELKQLYDGPSEGFEAFLSEHFFDLHYRAKENAEPINLDHGHLWRLACDYPESKTQPSIHRAPVENGEIRLLLIC